jgi:histidinol phosphatase-like enzyme (inositol monophosphatase family)
MALEKELAVARELLQDAGSLALEYAKKGVAVEDKADASPVTIADRECEKLIVGRLAKEFPDDGVLGEEGTNQQSKNGRRWIIDPIDGTRDFIRSSRIWCSLLALEAGGRVELGVAAFPALGEMYWAVRGQGAYRDGEQVRVSSITDIGKSVGCINQLERARHRPGTDRILDLMAEFWTIRCFGGALDAMYVCAGNAEFWLEPSAKPWDLAVLQVMAHEAGAAFFDYKGEDTIYGGNAVICVPALVPKARWFLGL